MTWRHLVVAKPAHGAPVARTLPDRVGWRHLHHLNMEEPMNKQELVDAVASAVGITKTAAGGAVDAFIAVVTQAVFEGEGVLMIRRPPRSERRVGKECRSRWSPYH